MNEAFEKILDRLEEPKFYISCLECQYMEKCDELEENITNEKKDLCAETMRDIAKQIVQEVAEEFATDTNVVTNGWIPCSERLPEEEADVLLSLRSLDVYTGFRANAEGCFYIDGDGYVEYENVIAWMPLPEPYKESDE